MENHDLDIGRLLYQVIHARMKLSRWQVQSILDVSASIVVVSHIYDQIILVCDLVALDDFRKLLPQFSV